MKRKIVTFMTLLLIVVTTFGQTLDGYKYVYVQTLTYQNDRTDIWDISSKLQTYFTNKGFIVLTKSTTLPKEIRQYPCLLLGCLINHTNVVYGTNEVTITLKNCKDEVVHSNTGGAAGWSVQDDFNKATKRAFSEINRMSYSFNPSKTPQIEFPKVEQTNETEKTIKNYLLSNKLDPIEGIYKSYQSDQLSYYKFGIIKKVDKFNAVIIESDLKHWKSGEVKAEFEKSSMKGFYSAKWYMGNKTSYETFALMENEAILSIEFKDLKTGEKITNKFIKMYPPINGDVTFKKDKSKSSGSGFFLTTDGIIATNAHVIENAETLRIQISNEIGNFDYSAKVLLVDNQNDVALIKIDDEKFHGFSSIPYSLIEKAEIGEKTFTIGYPLNDIMGTNYKVTDGIVSATSGIEDDIRYYQVSVPLQPGNSGGPLFNKDGNIIGITSARLNSKAVGTDIENVNYAIKISYLLNLYNMLPNINSLNTTPKASNKELQEQVKILKNYVCLIKVN